VAGETAASAAALELEWVDLGVSVVCASTMPRGCRQQSVADEAAASAVGWPGFVTVVCASTITHLLVSLQTLMQTQTRVTCWHVRPFLHV
jgi:hypothetical protein